MNKRAPNKRNIIKLLLTSLTAVLLLSGCRTYFGYESSEEKKDIAGSDRKVSSRTIDYDIHIDGDRISITAEQEDIYEKQVEVCEIRSHVYLSSTDLFKFTPMRWLIDLGHCWTSWHLYPNPPGFARRLFYAPPFCWFTFCIPPYWFDDPKNLSEGKTLSETHELDNGKTVNLYTVKTTECEKIAHTEPVKYPVRSRHLVTNGDHTGENIRVSGGEKTFELDADRPVVTREMLPPFISGSKAIVTDLGSAKGKDLKEKFTNFLFLEQVTLMVRYKNKTQKCHIGTVRFMTGEELWNCGCFCAAKGNFADGKKYFLLAAEKGYSPAMFLIGSSYLKGNKALGLDRDVAKGFSYVKKAADAGLKEAQCRLGDCYYEGEGVEKNYKQAVYWFRLAAEQGDYTAQYGLGKCYTHGRGVEKDLKQAKYWFGKVPTEIVDHDIRIDGDRIEIEAKLSDSGEPLYRVTNGDHTGEKIRVSIVGKTFELDTDRPIVTREMLPSFISHSAAISPDLSDAKKDLKAKFADFKFREKVPLTVEYKGTVRECEINTAVFMTGEELWNCGCSYVGKKDFAGGKRYFLLAAEREFPPAMFFIGGSYLKGDKIFGIEKNVEKGLAYVKKAADAGYADAGLKLAEMYIMLQDVRKKLPPGTDIGILARSAEEKKLLAFILSVDKSAARKYCEAALKRNGQNADALYTMARLMLEDGQIRSTVEYLELAAAQKHEAAQKLLPRCRERLKAAAEFEYYSKNNDPVVAGVKKCVFGLNRSVTLEQALADQLDDLRWRRVKDDRGHDFVEVVGVWNSNSFNGISTLPQENDEVMARFAVSKSGKVRFYYGEIRNADGEVKKIGALGMSFAAHTDPKGYLDRKNFLMLLYGIGSSEMLFYKNEYGEAILRIRMMQKMF